MTDKERLIEILNTKIHRKNGVPLEVVIADYLLDNDVVPVTRCENCKYYRCYMSGNIYCTHSEGLSSQPPNAFCSYGVPK